MVVGCPVGIENLNDRCPEGRIDLRGKWFSSSYQNVFQNPYPGGIPWRLTHRKLLPLFKSTNKFERDSLLKDFQIVPSSR